MNHILSVFLAAITLALTAIDVCFAQPSPFLDQYRVALETALVQNDPSSRTAYHARAIRIMAPFQKTIKDAQVAAAYYRAFSARFVVSSVQLKSMRTFSMDTLLADQGLKIITHIGSYD